MQELIIKTTAGDYRSFIFDDEEVERIVEEFIEKLSKKASDRWIQIGNATFNLQNVVYMEVESDLIADETKTDEDKYDDNY